MNQEVGLFVNGPKEWYENVQQSFNRHGRTWLQQSIELRTDRFKDLISSRGFFFVFGYVQTPYSNVRYRFKVDKIISSHQRIPPPDETTPPYSSYDSTQGKCRGPDDFKYKTWLKVTECKQIQPIEKEAFINLNNGRPIKSVRGNPHYYVRIPEGAGNDDQTESEPNTKQEPSGISLSLERDLENFIANNLDSIEDRLKLRKRQDSVSTGKVDLLCVDANDNLVVVELKAGTVGLDAIGQILSYISAVQQEIAEGRNVRGIIIGGDFESKVKITARTLPQLKLMKYNVFFKFEEVEQTLKKT